MACKLKPGASICAFILQMKWYFDRLESLNMVFDAKLSINIILSGLPTDYNQFVLLYQMNGKETLIMKLYSLLQTAEQGIKKIDEPSTLTAYVLTVGYNVQKIKTSYSKWKKKSRKRKVRSWGYWKHSCPKYLKDLKDRKFEKGSHSARRGAFLKREMISKEESESKIDLEKIQEFVDEEPIVNTDTQPKVVTPGKISDSTLSELDEPANYKEAMARPEAAKRKEAIKRSMSETDEELDRMSRVPYALAVGLIMYAMTCIRPDVSFALSMKKNKDVSRLEFGWVFLLNGGAVTWKSLKQDTVVDFTCEFEYIAACEALKEAI
ncbi:hypothetical protein Tco_1004807 [Tanacetum coccineum]|uniref:Uncharacterized protein n=1 Tax=Tanacetum coccineum TaxID=301880 RepID=A0ABQ5FDN1_9ASTR